MAFAEPLQGKFHGLLLGCGAWVIDARMHAQEEGGSFWGELVHVHGGKLLWLDDAHLPTQAREAIRFIYDKARSIESLAKEWLSIPTKTP